MIKTGFHAIEEFISAGISVNGGHNSGTKTGTKAGEGALNATIYFSKPGPRVKKILALAEKAGVKAFQVENSRLDEMVSGLAQELQDHRGIVLEILDNGAAKSSGAVDFDEWIKTGAGKKNSNDYCTVLVLDKITDPHNVGAILRSCDQFGVSLVILPEHSSVSAPDQNEVVSRTSAGASAWVPFCVVNNLVRTVQKLKEAGFWVFGADAGGTNCGKIDFPKKTALVMGSEGNGISKLLEEQCDSIVSIPTCGKIDSLNVSVAAGVLLYELYRRQNQD